MKKISIILLLCIYACSVLGIGVSQFYCCGKLKSINITFAEFSAKKCKMDVPMTGCCKTTFKSLKVKDTHIAADGITNEIKYFSCSQLLIGTFEPHVPIFITCNTTNNSNAPPLHHGVPVYIFNCLYLI